MSSPQMRTSQERRRGKPESGDSETPECDLSTQPGKHLRKPRRRSRGTNSYSGAEPRRSWVHGRFRNTRPSDRRAVSPPKWHSTYRLVWWRMSPLHTWNRPVSKTGPAQGHQLRRCQRIRCQLSDRSGRTARTLSRSRNRTTHRFGRSSLCGHVARNTGLEAFWRNRPGTGDLVDTRKTVLALPGPATPSAAMDARDETPNLL